MGEKPPAKGVHRGKSAAIAYTLIETAKLNATDLQAWLIDILSRIANHKINRIDELLPWRYAQPDSAERRLGRSPGSHHGAGGL